MEVKKIKKDRFVMFLIIYFIFLTLSFTMFTLSKYVGRVERMGTATIAEWDVDLDTTNGNEGVTGDTLSITSGTTSQDYRLNVTNNSEVSVSYSVIITSLPEGVTVAVDDGTPVAQDASHKVQFMNLGTIAADAATKTVTHKLTFAAPLGTAEINNDSINIEVVFVQDNPNN